MVPREGSIIIDLPISIPAQNSTSEDNIEGAKEIDFKHFTQLLSCNDDYFLQRIFSLMDEDGSGLILQKIFETFVEKFTVYNTDEKIELLFKIYDTDNDGLVEEDDFRFVIKACMVENGLKFDDEQCNKLASALFQDGVRDDRNQMNLEDFKEQIKRHDLVEGLSALIEKWMTPSSKLPEKPRQDNLQIPKRCWKNSCDQDSFHLLAICFGICLQTRHNTFLAF